MRQVAYLYKVESLELGVRTKDGCFAPLFPPKITTVSDSSLDREATLNRSWIIGRLDSSESDESRSQSCEAKEFVFW